MMGEAAERMGISVTDKTHLETTLTLAPRWDERGLIQAVATDADSGELLMVAHMNEAALERTVKTGEAHYWSRSRGEVWHKGATSGHVQRVVEMRIDCDQDALWLRVRPAGPACHTGERSCFYRIVRGGQAGRGGEAAHGLPLARVG